jgi:hypothetical protein
LTTKSMKTILQILDDVIGNAERKEFLKDDWY